MTKPSLNFALGDRLVGYFPAFDEFIWGKLGRIVNESGIAVYFLLPDDGSVPRNFIRGEGLGKTTREAVLSSRWWLRIHRSSAIAQARDSIAEAGTYDVQLRTIEERFETDNWSSRIPRIHGKDDLMWLSVVQDRNLKSRYEGGFRTNHEATEQAAYLELLADFFDSDVLDAAIVANHHDPEDVELENLTTERLKEIVESCFEDRYPRADWVIYDHDISSQFLADELAKQLGKT